MNGIYILTELVGTVGSVIDVERQHCGLDLAGHCKKKTNFKILIDNFKKVFLVNEIFIACLTNLIFKIIFFYIRNLQIIQQLIFNY